MSDVTPPERKRAKLYVALIFFCGAFAGVAGTNAWVNWWPRSASASADTPYSTQHRVERFTRELSLTPDQAKQLNQILDETHSKYRQLEDEQEQIRQQGRSRIRTILTEEQKPKYEQLLANIEATRRHTQHK
jgi:Spy/CpxP family protein refolding chaperone